MSASAAIAAGQAAAEQLMVDECAIYRQTGTQVNPNTGAEEPEYTTVYLGKCRTRMQSSWATDRQAGEQNITVSRYLLELPFSVVGVKVDDQVDITGSLDPDLVGRRIRIDGPFNQTHATMRRYICEEAD